MKSINKLQIWLLTDNIPQFPSFAKIQKVHKCNVHINVNINNFNLRFGVNAGSKVTNKFTAQRQSGFVQ